MPATNQSDISTVAAKQVWEAFQRQHDVSDRNGQTDVSDRNGQTAGVEPVTGRVWIGPSIETVIQQRDAEGSKAPLYFIRIGSPTHYIKRRTSLRVESLVT